MSSFLRSFARVFLDVSISFRAATMTAEENAAAVAALPSGVYAPQKKVTDNTTKKSSAAGKKKTDSSSSSSGGVIVGMALVKGSKEKRMMGLDTNGHHDLGGCTLSSCLCI